MSSDMQMVIETRYSFFGSSGWRSPASKEKDLLFDPTRLSKRLELFEKMNLASLRDQTDPDFKLVVLTSADLPKDHLERMKQACLDILGEERVRILGRKTGSAGQWLRRYVRNHLNTADHTAQVVLDDDDALSVDFVERCRREALYALSQFREGQECVYLSFANGFTGYFHEDGGMDLLPRDVAFTNLGLTLVAPTLTRKNPFLLAHKKVARRHDVRVFHERRPFYIRALHDTNDSRRHHGDTVLGPEAVKAAFTWFPLLKDLDLIRLRDAADAA